jgi:exosortase A-associated hydrolase 1
MRRLTSFACEGALLGASLDAGGGEIGLLMATGGSQTRVGSHRMYERLAKSLSSKGFSCFRFDRRGVGDSEGEDPGFRGSAPDIAAAAAAFRSAASRVRRTFGFGLCDGATALALFGDAARLDGLILVNPWLVESEAGKPPPAAILSHYRDRLTSLEGWKKITTGSIDYKKLLKGVIRVAGKHEGILAGELAAALHRHSLPIELIVASGDATAIAAVDRLAGANFGDLAIERQDVATDSHSFARSGDDDALLTATLAALRRLDL